jgi:hypothetical protein
MSRYTTSQLLWATLLVTGLSLLLGGLHPLLQAGLFVVQLVLLGLCLRSWLRDRAQS